MIGRRRLDGRVLKSDVDVTHFLIDSAGVAALEVALMGWRRTCVSLLQLQLKTSSVAALKLPMHVPA